MGIYDENTAQEVAEEKITVRGRKPRTRKESFNGEATQGQEKGKGKRQKVMFQRVPARLDFDPENPVVCHLRVDNTLERLDINSFEFSQDKLYLVQRRGMVANQIIIPLARLSYIQTMRLLPQPSQTAMQDLIPEAQELAKVAPAAAPKDYIVDPEKAKRKFIKDARNARKDYYKPEDDEETHPVDGAVTGAVLLDKGFNHVG